MTTAVFTDPARSSRAAASEWLSPVMVGDDARRAVAQLYVGRLHVDHQVSVDITEANHCARREHVEDELGRGAGLHARRAGYDFRSCCGRDGEFRGLGNCGFRYATEADGESAQFACVADAAKDVRRAAARGDSHQNVFGRRSHAARDRGDPAIRRPQHARRIGAERRLRRQSGPAPSRAACCRLGDTRMHRGRRDGRRYRLPGKRGGRRDRGVSRWLQWPRAIRGNSRSTAARASASA